MKSLKKVAMIAAVILVPGASFGEGADPHADKEKGGVTVSASGSKTSSGTSESTKYSAKAEIEVEGVRPISDLQKLVLLPAYFVEFEKSRKSVDGASETGSSVGFGATIIKYVGSGGGTPFVEAKVSEKDKYTSSSGVVGVDDTKSLVYWTYGIEYRPANSEYLKLRFYRSETTNTRDTNFRESESGVALKFTLKVK